MYCFIKNYSSEIVSIRKLGLGIISIRKLKAVAARQNLPLCIRDFRPKIDIVDVYVVAHILILSDKNINSRLIRERNI